jgi:hypothetical protein
MADSQVPWGVDALGGSITEAAWRPKPSWYLVATEDRMNPPPAQRAMSERAGSTVVEAAGSHAIYGLSAGRCGGAHRAGCVRGSVAPVGRRRVTSPNRPPRRPDGADRRISPGRVGEPCFDAHLMPAAGGDCSSDPRYSTPRREIGRSVLVPDP